MADTPSYTCVQCGAAFTGRKRKYCSQHCNMTAANRRKGKIPLAVRLAERAARMMRECPECHRMFRKTRHDTHSKGPQVYCSLDCRHAKAAKARRIEQEATVLRLWGLGWGRGIEATKYQRWGQRARTPCVDCGKPVGVSRTRTRPAMRCGFCSDTIAKVRNKASPSRRAAKSRRRALERGTEAERFDPYEVFERDGWRCHICKCSTPKRLRGTYDNRAPELDHIIPLAAGGSHTRLNTACSCRKCNSMKADKPLGQLRLLA